MKCYLVFQQVLVEALISTMSSCVVDWTWLLQHELDEGLPSHDCVEQQHHVCSVLHDECVGISYTGIWCQSLISATSFFILINVNKFAIIGIEAVFMSKELTWAQVMGALITIFGGVTYGKAQEALSEKEVEPLVAKPATP
eukprot:s2919_g6.t1